MNKYNKRISFNVRLRETLFQLGLLLSFIFITSCGGGSGTVPAGEPAPENIIALSSSGQGVCVIRASGSNDSGKLWCWGRTAASIYNKSNHSDIFLSPVQISGRDDLKNLSLNNNASSHLCVVSNAGELLCLGSNGAGQIGVDPSSPFYQRNDQYRELTPVTSEKDWLSVTTGNLTSCAIKVSGSVWCWGNNSNAKLATNDTVSASLYIKTPTAILKSPATVDDSSWQKISLSGSAHSCGIKRDGSLWCWGKNDWVFGTAPSRQQVSPVIYPKKINQPLNNQLRWIELSVGIANVCGIIESSRDSKAGSLWCWGGNLHGELAQDSKPDFIVKTASQVGRADNWVKVQSISGSYSNCAVNTLQQLFCWGQNANFQLGLNRSSDSFIPVLVDAGDKQNWTDVAGGGSFFCGIKNLKSEKNNFKHSVWCWGANDLAQSGTGKTSSSYVPTQVYPSADVDGVAAKWLSLATSGVHYCGLIERANGKSAWCWGNNESGKLGIGSEYKISIPIQEVTLSNTWMNLSSSSNNCGTQTDKSVWCWGSYEVAYILDFNQTYNKLSPNKISLLNNTITKQWQFSASGPVHSCAIDTNDELFCWGRSLFGETGRLTTTPTAPGQAPAFVTSIVPVNTPADQAAAIKTKWLSVSLAGNSSCAIRKTEQSLWCWGSTENYQFMAPELAKKNQNGFAYSDSPVQIKPVNTSWLSVNVMAKSICAVDSNNTLYCWGEGAGGRLGINTQADPALYPNAMVTKPTIVNSPDDNASGVNSSWKPIGTGTGLCAIKLDGSLWCTGGNQDGQLGINPINTAQVDEMTAVLPSTNDWLTVTSAGSSVCAIKRDNSLWCWGSNRFGQLGDGKAFNTTPRKVNFQ